MTLQPNEPERAENLWLTAALILATVLSIGMILLVLMGHVRAEPLTVFRNDKGQIVGYGEKRGNSTTTFSNPLGQEVGRAERQRDGTTTFYDSAGRIIGTSRGADRR
jgi:hypothetical protein